MSAGKPDAQRRLTLQLATGVSRRAIHFAEDICGQDPLLDQALIGRRIDS